MVMENLPSGLWPLAYIVKQPDNIASKSSHQPGDPGKTKRPVPFGTGRFKIIKASARALAR